MRIYVADSYVIGCTSSFAVMHLLVESWYRELTTHAFGLKVSRRFCLVTSGSARL